MRNAQFGGHRRKTKVGGPDLVTLQDRGGEKVHVDPAETNPTARNQMTLGARGSHRPDI